LGLVGQDIKLKQAKYKESHSQPILTEKVSKEKVKYEAEKLEKNLAELIPESMLTVQKVKKHFDKRLKEDEKEKDILNFDGDTFNLLMKQPKEPTDMMESFVEEKKPKSVY
jgi:uncharacterized membrane protein YheB (UPF0754 family)